MSIMSLMVVVIIFQAYRTVANPRLIAVGWGAARLMYAVGMVLADRKSFYDPWFVA
jgi:hypothetical protein